ncbi:MAG TPA: MBL fold metallo-hydrolase [Gemmatimonadales bacterium]|nr:MBL fold metallo-hydrolase [Gemmatimonadales bacterium]
MALSQSFSVGSLRCHLLEAGDQWLDGGAMFGVVPKPLWSRRATPDAKNRIPLAMRCVLVEHPDGLVLIDTGLGNKEDEKFLEIYGVKNEGNPTQLEDAIRAAGHRPEDVSLVINTHLHFDHAGGNTRRSGGQADRRSDLFDRPPAGPPDRPALAFPKALYVVQKKELDFARHTNERTRASYLPHNFEPVAEASRWKLLDGPGEIIPGISAMMTPGHVPWHQSIVIRNGGETVVFLGDIIPTAAHLPLPYIMGYDLEPLRTLETKRSLLQDAVNGGWRFIFEHDPVVALARVVEDGKAAGLADVVVSGTGKREPGTGASA